MGERTGIEWTDTTFNPWWGCTKVSPACDHCYAERDAHRFDPGRVLWGPGAERRTFGDDHWQKPLQWARSLPGRLGRRPRVFCASMADVFDNEAPEGARDRLWGLIRTTPELDWLLLTKRIGNARTMMPGPLANVWLGISVVNQDEADRDIPKLLATPARVRFLSCEPLLGPISLRQVAFAGDWARAHYPAILPVPWIDWVIAGGESGPHARPSHPEWFRSLRDQCATAGVPFLFKQWGEWAPHDPQPGGDLGGDMRRDRVRILHAPGNPEGHFRRGDALVRRVGKQVAGRELDGVLHDGFPTGVL